MSSMRMSWIALLTTAFAHAGCASESPQSTDAVTAQSVALAASSATLPMVEGQAARVLNAGDSFYEPANTKIIHFDALDKPSKFVANYLLAENEHELIQMLDIK
jgi:hypothetical protein